MGTSCNSCVILQRTFWLIMQLLSRFFFPALVLLCSCIHGLRLNRNSGATPYSVMESFHDSHQLFQLRLPTVARVTHLEILLIESLVRQSPAILAAFAYCHQCHSDSLHRISFAIVTSCSSYVCLLLLVLRSRNIFSVSHHSF